MSELNWQRSYICESSGCVEFARLSDGVAIRSSRDPDGPVVTLSADAWIKFASGTGDGFDVVAAGDHVFVQHPGDPKQATLTFSRSEWDAFLAGVLAGNFEA